MEEISKSNGNFFIEYIFQQCFMRNHVLSIELSKPIIIKGKPVLEFCIQSIAESEEMKKILLQRVLNKENSDGKLLVNAFTESPFDCDIVSIDNRDILNIELKLNNSEIL